MEKPNRTVALVALVALLAAAAAAYVWIDTRARLGATQDDVTRRLRDAETDSREARAAARQAQEALREAQARNAQLDARLSELQSRQLGLDALYQELSRNRDEWQLAEIEQVLAIAAQQLQLSGNVRAALLALQLAEARLARADRPQFVAIRAAIARDIERLKALPVIDIPGLSLRLSALAAGADALPMAFDERLAPPAVPPVAGPAEGFWARLGADIWEELKQLIVVRRTDLQDPPLLPPQQAFFVRENVRLRLLSARLALLARDEADYREDLRAAQAWIRKYYDVRAKPTADALAELRQLSAASLSFEMPSIADSLDAVRGYRARRGRGG